MTSNRRERLRRPVLILVGLAISAGFLALLVRKIDLGRVADEIAKVRLEVLSLTLLTAFGGFLAMSCRSWVLLRPLRRYPFWTLFKSALVGFAGNNVLPLRMGELLRMDYLARRGGCPHSSVLAVVAMERLLDVSWLVLLFCSILPLAVMEGANLASVFVVGAVVFAALCTFFVIARDQRRFGRLLRRLSGFLGARISNWLGDKAVTFAEGLGALSSWRAAAGVFLITGVFWLMGFVSIRIVLWAFAIELPWYAPAVVLVFVAFGGALPSAPAFVGTYHYFAVLALTSMAVEADLAASVAVVQHAVVIVPFTVIAVLLLFGEIFRKRPTNGD